MILKSQRAHTFIVFVCCLSFSTQFYAVSNDLDGGVPFMDSIHFPIYFANIHNAHYTVIAFLVSCLQLFVISFAYACIYTYRKPCSGCICACKHFQSELEYSNEYL